MPTPRDSVAAIRAVWPWIESQTVDLGNGVTLSYRAKIATDGSEHVLARNWGWRIQIIREGEVVEEYIRHGEPTEETVRPKLEKFEQKWNTE